MNFSLFRGIKKVSDLTVDIYNGHWSNWTNFWNNTDTGKLPMSNIAYGLSTNSKTSAYTATITDHLLLMDTSSAALTLTLPNSVGIKGKVYVVFNIGTKALTVNTTSTQTINGGTSLVLPQKYFHAEIFSDGANWLAI